MGKIKPLTELEKIAITAGTVQTSPDWLTLWKLSHPDSSATNYKAIVIQWTNSAKFKEFQKFVQVTQEDKINKRVQEELEKRLSADSEPGTRTTKTAPDLIDYSDPQQQRRKLNELVNTAEDQKEALDALKTIIATQKDDRDSARERKQIQSYLPIKCKSCPLYLAELQKT